MSELFKGKFSRRLILTTAGLGAISTTAIGSISEEVAAQVPTQQPTPRKGPLPPQIQFPPIFASTEVETGGPPTALPPERRLGFAIVGLGRLSLEEIMPAFAECNKLAKPTALVSGDATYLSRASLFGKYTSCWENVGKYLNRPKHDPRKTSTSTSLLKRTSNPAI
ncbi:hypothetical protein [Nostoc sp.]|uniref:hypothetical protein n=1 Tax=Nostoc sp. TaxID=1180 RepID=UPI002FF5B23E